MTQRCGLDSILHNDDDQRAGPLKVVESSMLNANGQMGTKNLVASAILGVLFFL